mmetsp:Transcript_27528/g.51660  ORF Transcript_27528/g.51660 Transcript_27528/m.51660 type:complete len:464 (-) Transcript_27528:1073-2464(-)
MGQSRSPGNIEEQLSCRKERNSVQNGLPWSLFVNFSRGEYTALRNHPTTSQVILLPSTVQFASKEKYCNDGLTNTQPFNDSDVTHGQEGRFIITMTVQRNIDTATSAAVSYGDDKTSNSTANNNYSIHGATGVSHGSVLGVDASQVWKRLICNPGFELAERELLHMKPSERTVVYSDLGGAQHMDPEWPEGRARALAELEAKVRAMDENQTKAFRLAQAMAPEYTDSTAFRLKFLRADVFDTEKAARRLVKHFEEKLVLFGREALGRDITLRDFSEDDLDSLACGGLQILPRPDQFGRLILFSRQVQWKYKRHENILRVLWYLCQAMMETQDAQIRGIVAIGFDIGTSQQLERGWSCDYELLRRMIRVFEASTCRLLASYSCIDSSYFESVVDVASHLMNKFLRARYRCIRGTRQECNYQLMVMGIRHVEDFPISEDGHLMVDRFHGWLRERWANQTQNNGSQ